MGLRWEFGEKAGTLTVIGEVIRVTEWDGSGRFPVPQFATEVLQKRRHSPYCGEQEVNFPSTREPCATPITLLSKGAMPATNSILVN